MNITDNQTLISARKGPHEIPTYDDGFGPLWIHYNSIGISGIVRAQTIGDAYSICEDEFFPEANETPEELSKEYDFKRGYVRWIFEKDGGSARVATLADYPIKEGQFSHWQTVSTPDPRAWPDNPLFQEAFGFRPSGPNTRDALGHGIYVKDLNGDQLEPLTDHICQELGITLTITTQ